MSILKTLNHLYSNFFMEFLKDPSLVLYSSYYTPLLSVLSYLTYQQTVPTPFLRQTACFKLLCWKIGSRVRAVLELLPLIGSEPHSAVLYNSWRHALARCISPACMWFHHSVRCSRSWYFNKLRAFNLICLYHYFFLGRSCQAAYSYLRRIRWLEDYNSRPNSWRLLYSIRWSKRGQSSYTNKLFTGRLQQPIKRLSESSSPLIAW